MNSQFVLVTDNIGRPRSPKRRRIIVKLFPQKTSIAQQIYG